MHMGDQIGRHVEVDNSVSHAARDGNWALDIGVCRLIRYFGWRLNLGVTGIEMLFESLQAGVICKEETRSIHGVRYSSQNKNSLFLYLCLLSLPPWKLEGGPLGGLCEG